MERSMKDWHDDFSKLLGEKGQFIFRQKDEKSFVFSGVKNSLCISDFPVEKEVEVSVNDFSLKIKGKNPESIFAYLQKNCKKN